MARADLEEDEEEEDDDDDVLVVTRDLRAAGGFDAATFALRTAGGFLETFADGGTAAAAAAAAAVAAAAPLLVFVVVFFFSEGLVARCCCSLVPSMTWFSPPTPSSKAAGWRASAARARVGEQGLAWLQSSHRDDALVFRRVQAGHDQLSGPTGRGGDEGNAIMGGGGNSAGAAAEGKAGGEGGEGGGATNANWASL